MDVILLTQPHCDFCDQAKAVLARLSREFPLSVREIELASAHGQRLACEGGVMFAPGVFVEGEPFSYGRLSERKLRRELRRRVQQLQDAYYTA
jgi:glutaredoxin